jgi:hypothetical protein
MSEISAIALIESYCVLVFVIILTRAFVSEVSIQSLPQCALILLRLCFLSHDIFSHFVSTFDDADFPEQVSIF